MVDTRLRGDHRRRRVVRGRVPEEGAVIGGIRRARAWRRAGSEGTGNRLRPAASRRRPNAHLVVDRWSQPFPAMSALGRPQADVVIDIVPRDRRTKPRRLPVTPSRVAVAPRPGGCQPCPRPAAGWPAHPHRAAASTKDSDPPASANTAQGRMMDPPPAPDPWRPRSTIAPVEHHHADRRERRHIICTGNGRTIPLPQPPRQPPPPQPGKGG
jgi:hypothetical protein